MKKYKIYLLLLCAVMGTYSVQAQLIQAGIRGEMDMQSKTNFLHNGSLGLEVDVNVPLVGVGASAAVMYSMKYFNNKVSDSFDDLYHYITVPVNLKWNFGIRPLKLVVMFGPYVNIPLDKNIGKDELGKDDFNSTIYGLNAQVGVELLKHYRFSLGFKRDIILNDLDDYIDPSSNLYLGLMYIF